jgi:hypothetical protein
MSVQSLEGCFLPRIIDQGGPRFGTAAKGRLVIVAQPQIQYEILTKANFILSVNGKYR